MLGGSHFAQRDNVFSRLRAGQCVAQQLDSKPRRRAQARTRKKHAAKQKTKYIGQNAAQHACNGLLSYLYTQAIDAQDFQLGIVMAFITGHC